MNPSTRTFAALAAAGLILAACTDKTPPAPAAPSAAAAPAPADTSLNVHQVFELATSGHLDQAEQLMQGVLQQHPESAKAHYVEAQLLYRAGKLDQARGELATADRLEPGLPFAKPEAVAMLRAQLVPVVELQTPVPAGGEPAKPAAATASR